MTFSPFIFFFFTSLFSSLSPSQPIATSKRSQHRTHSQHPNTEPTRNDPFCRSPFATISSNYSPSLPNRSPYLSLLLAHHRFCLPSLLLPLLHLLAVVAEACSSSLELARRHWSLLVVANQTPATFRLPPTPTLQLPFADSAPTALRLPTTPIVRLPFAASNPSNPSASTSTDDPSPSLQTFFFPNYFKYETP